MTIKEFRSIPSYSARMREILTDETFQLALITLRDSNTPLEGAHEDELDAIASVRRFSRVSGFNNAIAALLGMGTPIMPPPTEEEATYGTENE